jgi:hypothetical protein
LASSKKSGAARSGVADRMAHGGPIRAVAIAPSGRRLACLAVEEIGGKTTCVVAEWDLATGKRMAMFPVPWQRYLLAWRGNDEVLVHDDEGLGLWNLRTERRKPLAPLRASGRGFYFDHVRASANGETIAVLEDRSPKHDFVRVRLLDARGKPRKGPPDITVKNLGLGDVTRLLEPAVTAAELAGATPSLVNVVPELSADGTTLWVALYLNYTRPEKKNPTHHLHVAGMSFLLRFNIGDRRWTVVPTRKEMVHELHASRDGRWLVHNQTLFDAKSLRPVRQLSADVFLLAADGAAFAERSQKLSRHAMPSGKRLAAATLAWRGSVLAADATEKLLALAVDENIVVVDARTLRPPRALRPRMRPRGLGERVEALAIDPPPGRGVIYAGDARQLCAFDLETGKVRWRRPISAYAGAALAPNGKSLFAGGTTTDCATGRGPEREGYGTPAAVWCDDGRLVRVDHADIGERRSVFELRIAVGLKGTVRKRIRFPSLRCIPELSADGRRALVNDEFQVWGVDLDRGAILWKKKLRGVMARAVSPDGARCVLTGWNLLCLDMRTGKELFDIVLPDRQLTTVAWSPDGERIAVGCRDGSIVHFRTGDLTPKRGRKVEPPPETAADRHAVEVSTLAFSRDGRWLASGANDGSVLAHRVS